MVFAHVVVHVDAKLIVKGLNVFSSSLRSSAGDSDRGFARIIERESVCDLGSESDPIHALTSR